MMEPDSKPEPEKLLEIMQQARSRVTAAEVVVESARRESQIAKQKRKEAKEGARRAKKKLRRAMDDLVEARSLLVEAEENALQQLRSTASPARPPKPFSEPEAITHLRVAENPVDAQSAIPIYPRIEKETETPPKQKRRVSNPW